MALAIVCVIALPGLAVTASAQQAPTEISRTLDATIGDFVDEPVSANDANRIIVELEEGSLPSGLELIDGRLTGVVNVAGVSKAAILATDGSTGEQQRHTFAFTIEDQPVVEIPRSLSFTVGDAVDEAVVADEGGVFAVLESGALPSGVALVDARLSGGVDTAGDSTAAILVTNSITGERQRIVMSIAVIEPAPRTRAEIRAERQALRAERRAERQAARALRRAARSFTR